VSCRGARLIGVKKHVEEIFSGITFIPEGYQIDCKLLKTFKDRLVKE